MTMRHRMRLAALGLASLLLSGLSLTLVGTAIGPDAGAASPHVFEQFPDIQFSPTTLGTFSTSINPVTLDNDISSTTTIDLLGNDVSITGTGADDYVITPGNCPGDGATTIVLAAFQSCQPAIAFYPGALGSRAATLSIFQNSDPISFEGVLQGVGTTGYYQVDAQGSVANLGDAASYGDVGGAPLNKPIVGMAQTGDNGGYWLVASDGGIFNYGDAGYFGSTGAIHLNKPIVGMAATPDAGGYWLVASDGGIFAYGDATFYGSTGGIHLNQPIVGMAATPDGAGYWLVASDGGIFAYGDASFYGSTGAIHLNKPVVGMASTPDGGGYWFVASDGGIFNYGDAHFYGSTGGIRLNQPIVGMAAMPDGGGYWLTAVDGGLFNFGNAPYLGSGVGTGLGRVVGMAGDGPSTIQAFLGLPAIRAGHLDSPMVSSSPRSLDLGGSASQ
jgi:hypothetical protein